MQWLRDGLQVIGNAADTEALAAGSPTPEACTWFPRSPAWVRRIGTRNARGAVYGLTRDAGPAHLARAALESVCLQTRDLMGAMEADRGAAIDRLRVDGGMVENAWLLQSLADIVGVSVERPRIVETTALGAACLAGLHAGVFRSLADIGGRWARDAQFMPRMSVRDRERLIRGWESAVARTLEHHG